MSCNFTSNGTNQHQNGPSNLFTPYRKQPRSTWTVVAYSRPHLSATKRTKYASIRFNQQAQVSQDHASYRCKKKCNTEVRDNGGLGLVKLARDPAPNHPKPCASLKIATGVLPVCCSLLTLVRRKHTVVRDSFSLRNLPVRAFGSRAQGFSTPLTRMIESCPPSSPKLVLTHSIEHATVRLHELLRPTRLSVTVVPASRVPPPPGGPKGAPNWSSEEEQLVNTILDQQNRRRVSVDRLYRGDSQLVASLEGESSLTPAGKDPPALTPRNQVSEGEGTRWKNVGFPGKAVG